MKHICILADAVTQHDLQTSPAVRERVLSHSHPRHKHAHRKHFNHVQRSEYLIRTLGGDEESFR